MSFKKTRENFSNHDKNFIDKFLDEILSYFPFYFRLPINFFRSLLEKVGEDPMYLVYTYGLFVIIKVYIRGRIMPASEVYADSMI